MTTEAKRKRTRIDKIKSTPNTNIPFLLNNNNNDMSSTTTGSHQNVNVDPTQLKFICDSSLMRLAKHLRLLGCDCAFEQDANSYYVMYLARCEDRIILTKNRAMVKHIIQRKKEHENRIAKFNSRRQQAVTTIDEDPTKQELYDRWEMEREEVRRKEYLSHQQENLFEEESEEEDEDEEDEFYEHKYYLLKASKPLPQIDEVVHQFKIPCQPDKVFTICIKCNHSVVSVPDKQVLKGKVFENVYRIFDHFYQCTSCDQIYWGTRLKDNAQNFAVEHSYKAKNQVIAADQKEQLEL